MTERYKVVVLKNKLLAELNGYYHTKLVKNVLFNDLELEAAQEIVKVLNKHLKVGSNFISYTEYIYERENEEKKDR